MAQFTISGFGGVALAVEDWGEQDEPAVVLVHGLGQNRASWKRTVRDLVEAGRRVVTFDLRGHGASGRPPDGRYDLTAYAGDLVAVLDSLPTRPVVVGALVGGWIAAVAVGETAGRLASGLVLVEAAPWLDDTESQRLEEALRSHDAGFANLEDAVSAMTDLHPKRRPPKPETIAARLSRGPDGRLRWNWEPRALGSIDLAEVIARVSAALPRVTLPVLAIRGGRSDLVDAEAAARLAALIPQAEQAEVEGAGTFVASDRTDRFDALLIEFLERRLPRKPLAFSAGSDARTLRDALGCFATGVTVVTTRAPDGTPVGLTANSFTSVSLDPPLILVCLARTVGTLEIFQSVAHFAINILHIGQQPVSDRFARKQEDRFAATPHECWKSDVPILSGTLASFECRRHAVHEGGDHVILVGLVERVQFEPSRDPLLYFRGRYRRLHFS